MVEPNITAIKEKIKTKEPFTDGLAALSSGESVVFDGMIGNSPLLLSALIAEDTGKLLILLCPNIGEVEPTAEDLTLFTDSKVLTYPVLPSYLTENEVHQDEIFLSEDRIFGERLRVLNEIEKRTLPDFGFKQVTPLKQENESPLASRLHNKNQNKKIETVPVKTPPLILVTTLAAIRQPVPTRSEMTSHSFLLEVGKEYDRESILGWLSQGGFHSTSAVELPGEYSVRGGILDIYAIDGEQPIRIEFFGDEIESIRLFDGKTQRSTDDLTSIRITRLRSNMRVTGRFTDHLPVGTIPVFLETQEILRQAAKLDRYFADKTADNKTEKNFSDESDMQNSPDAETSQTAFTRPFSVAQICNALYRFPTLHAVTIASGNELAQHNYSFLFQSIDRMRGSIQSVRDEIDKFPAQVRFGIVCRTEAEQRRIADTLSMTNASKEKRLDWFIGTLSHGFAWPEENIILVGTDELFGRMNLRHSRARTLSESIDSFVDLSPGDLVIHVGHGLARFRGLKMISKGQQEEEHLELEFADNISLYVPSSKIGLIQKYVGTSQLHPKLAKLNGKAWSRQKLEVQKAVFDLAAEMIDIQAKRESLHGISYPPDSDWQRDFDESFPFDPTEDQLLAIEAIKSDMERQRPMDRLLCGDVGFGKTEVAIRAAFKAVDAGYQVAVLVPTTVLADQHFRVFSDRMSGFPVKLGVLSRFCSKKEISETLEKLRLGQLDIVIGTHRLVQKDVAFKNLGLVIIDEEQRFGVKDKDYMKHFRNLVDVLTMTATPIPRTLHFSLLGIRDISNLQTPPCDRLPIETKVLKYNPAVIREGVLYEMSRGGQVYFLHNRVQDIDEFAAKLRDLIPEARIGVGHAQMESGELEIVMRRFLNHEYDVLLSTTIIESGLDIPNANTIFINNANRFGLAELHQLRGRVGRYKNQAYCYLLLAPNAPMTRDSMQRLRAIEEYSHLGAGFQLALRDLELRGAGNILGVEQSGHINIVGYEMYCEFLDAAVRLLKQQPQKVKLNVEVDLPGSAIIPENYVPEIRDRIDLYRRLNRVTTIDESDSLRSEITDRFGKLPMPVERLILCSKIRVEAWPHGIRTIKISEGPEGQYVAFTFVSIDLISQLREQLKSRSIDLRVINQTKAVITIPKRFYGENDMLDPDRLLYYVMKVLKEQ